MGPADVPSLRIAAVGDVMLGESFYQYGRGPRSQIAKLGERFLPTDLQDLLRSHDIVFGNVECVLSDMGYRPGNLRSHQMRGSPVAAALLRRWGFSLVNVANNHMLEHGREAAIDTVRHLQSAGLAIVGAGPGQSFGPGLEPVVLCVAGLRVGVLAACLLREKYAAHGDVDEVSLLAAVAALRPRCDVLIVSLHWGVEYMGRPTAMQRYYAHRLVDGGATLVLGHHPHVVQGVERRNAGLIAYSLGNFIFDQAPADTRWSCILSSTVNSGCVETWDCRPLLLNDRHAPELPSGLARFRLESELRRRHALLAKSALSPSAYAAATRCALFRSRLSRFRAIARALVRSPTTYSVQLLLRPLLRRLGAW